MKIKLHLYVVALSVSWHLSMGIGLDQSNVRFLIVIPNLIFIHLNRCDGGKLCEHQYSGSAGLYLRVKKPKLALA